MTARAIGYWLATGIIAMEGLVGGVVGLTNGREMVVMGEPIDTVLAHLGYPVYFGRVLGVAEVLAGVAILAPGVPRLKEWADAGFFFTMAGAAVSRAVRGSDLLHIDAPLFMAGLRDRLMGASAAEPSTRHDRACFSIILKEEQQRYHPVDQSERERKQVNWLAVFLAGDDYRPRNLTTAGGEHSCKHG